MFDIVSAGELLIDFAPSINKADKELTFIGNPGGAPANVLAMASKLGLKTAFIGKVGDDVFGKKLKKTLEEQNINSSGLILSKEFPTTLAFVSYSPSGDRSFSFYRKNCADIMLKKEEINLSLIDECSIFHFGSLSFTDEPCRSAVLNTIDYAIKKGKIISFDPNYRPLLWSSEKTAVEQIKAGCRLANILKISDYEMELVTGIADFEQGSAELLSYGPEVVIVTAGEKGAFYKTAKSSGLFETYKVKTIDTTGAGDAFFGAILSQFKGKTINQIKDFSEAEWKRIMNFANAAGSLTTTRQGAIPALPSLNEIENLIKQNQ